MVQKRNNIKLPTFDEFLIPTVKAIKELGGSGTIDEINTKIYRIAKISDSELEIPHGDEGSTSEIDYRIAWCRTYLKKFGLIENSTRGVWALTRSNMDISKLNREEILRTVRGQAKSTNIKLRTKKVSEEEIDEEINEEVSNNEEWKEKLLSILYKIKPDAFERLTQRLLRESGFFQVTVTGKPGDRGIDGTGKMRINGLLSFNVVFQCKRYKGSVSSKEIREFRGAMSGREVRGLFITTGTFSKESLIEADKESAVPIDLINGDQLCDKLKELNLGVVTKLIENVEIKEEWFGDL